MNKEFWKEWWGEYKKALKDNEAASLFTGAGLAFIIFGIVSAIVGWKMLSIIAVLFGVIWVAMIPVVIFFDLKKRYKTRKD